MIRANKGALKRLDNLVAAARARAAGGAIAQGGIVVTAADEISPGALTGTTTGTPIPVAAFDVTPAKSGLYLVGVTINFTLSAADTVTWGLDAIPAVTGISGGATLRETFHYEQTGSALVITGGSAVPQLVAQEEIATGQITAQTLSLTGSVGVLSIGQRQAIELAVFTAGGAQFTALGITNAYAIEL